MSLPPNPDDPRPEVTPPSDGGAITPPPIVPPDQRPAPPTQPTQPTPVAPSTQQMPTVPSGGWTPPPSSGGWQQPPIGPPPGGPYGGPGSGPNVPPVWGPPPGGHVTRGPNRMALIAIVSVLAVAAAGFAAVNLSAGGQAGASSPEGAVEELFGAIGNEDLIGVLEEVSPAERDVMMSWFQGLESDLNELGIIDDVNLNDVGGIDFEVNGLEATSEEVMPGVSKVTVTGGELSFATEPDSVPVGDVLENLIEANGGEVDIERAADEVDFAEQAQDEYSDPLFLVATENDGRWYLSLSYTIAEYARLDSGEDVPDPEAGVAPQGAPTAEDAARDFLTAAVDLDVERVISLLPPDSMGALQDYAPLFLDDAQESVAEYRDEEGYEGTVEGLEFETSGVDGGTRVVPTAGTATFSFYDGDVALSMQDGDICVEASGDLATDFEDEWGTSVVCQGDLGDLGGELSDEERAELDELGALFSDYQAGLVVVERDGAFYVDPLRTVSDLTLQVFDGIDRADLEEGGILYRIFTGESFLFPEYEEDYEDYDVDFEGEGEGEGGGSGSAEETETVPAEVEPAGSESFELGYDIGYEAGFSAGAADLDAGADYGTSADYSIPDAPPDAADAFEWEDGYMEGYFLGYDEAYFGG